MGPLGAVRADAESARRRRHCWSDGLGPATAPISQRQQGCGQQARQALPQPMLGPEVAVRAAARAIRAQSTGGVMLRGAAEQRRTRLAPRG